MKKSFSKEEILEALDFQSKKVIKSLVYVILFFGTVFLLGGITAIHEINSKWIFGFVLFVAGLIFGNHILYKDFRNHLEIYLSIDDMRVKMEKEKNDSK